MSDELIVGGEFSDWPEGQPDGWTVYDDPPDAEISQVGVGEGHGGEGTGYCNFYASYGLFVSIRQTVPLVVGRRYMASLKVDKIVAQGIKVYDSPTQMFSDKSYTTTGTKTFTFVATGTTMTFYIDSILPGPADVTIDDVSITPCRLLYGMITAAAKILGILTGRAKMAGTVTGRAKMAGTVTGRAKMAGAVTGRAKMAGTVTNITSQ